MCAVDVASRCQSVLVRLVAVDLRVAIFPASVQSAVAVYSAPDDHFTASPDCRVTVRASGRVGRAGGRPTVGAGIVSAAGVQILDATSSMPPQTIISLPVHTAV